MVPANKTQGSALEAARPYYTRDDVALVGHVDREIFERFNYSSLLPPFFPANVSTACAALGTSVFMFDETVDSDMQVGCCKCHSNSLVHIHLPVATEVPDRGTVTKQYFRRTKPKDANGLNSREGYELEVCKLGKERRIRMREKRVEDEQNGWGKKLKDGVGSVGLGSTRFQIGKDRLILVAG